MFSSKSVISIKGDQEVSIKYGAGAQEAAQLAALMDRRMTAAPQKSELGAVSHAADPLDMSVKESLMNTFKNPMVSPQTSQVDAQKHNLTE